METDIKKRILDAASAVAKTPESKCSSVPELLRRRIDLWFDACEELIPETIEIIKWFDASREVPVDNRNVLIFHKDVWVGYFDHEDQIWRMADGQVAGHLTHWAMMPKGPKVAA